MKKLINFIISISEKTISKKLGRWNVEKCNKIINRKIDLSNEDNCGISGHIIKNVKI